MKKSISLFLLTIVLSVSIFAKPKQVVPDKIQEIFHKEFPNIENVTFSQNGDIYTVYFKTGNNSSERVYYNSNEEMIKTIKYYTENELEPFIRQKVNRKYEGKILNITEVLSDAEHFYQIILQGDKIWYVIKSDTKGSMEIQKRWKGNIGENS